MILRILALGDFAGPGSVEFAERKLRAIIRNCGAHFTIANCENASSGNGLSRNDAEQIFNCGVDVITTGNHVWRQNSLRDYLDECDTILRPMNYPDSTPGVGSLIYKISGVRALVMNVQGNVYMSDILADPFDCVEKELLKHEGEYDISILDIHAEATGEKMALARYFDGRINIIFGTHTHVQTADEQILPGGTGYITDLGMCGSKNSILGVKSDIIIEHFRTKLPKRFIFEEEDIAFCGAVFEIDTATGKVLNVERINIE